MSFAGDPLAFYAKRILDQHHAALLKRLPPIKPDSDAPNPFDISDDVLRFLPHLKVGILGAGVGGLYTALMLDSIGIEYEILESTDRVGGRLSTYRFAKGEKYDYYEAGAMRFPLPKKDAHGKYKDGTMKRLAELVEYGPLNTIPGDGLKDQLIPYYYNARPGSRPGFYYFNGVHEDISSQPKGPFDAKAMKVDAEYEKAGADAINNDVTNPFLRMLINDIQHGTTSGWDVVMSNDTYSVRGYMASKYMPSDSLKLPPQHLSSNVINWLALLGGGSGAGSSGWDRALTEAIFESLAFAQVGDSDYGDVDWKCFEGGTETLSKRMEAYIRKQGGAIELKKRVTAVGQGTMVVSLPEKFAKHNLPSGVNETQSKEVDVVVEAHHLSTNMLVDTSSSDRLRIEIPCVTVTVNGNETRNYSQVISTLPLPVLRTIDLNEAGLNILQKNALRALDYGPAVKIGMLFKSDWWTTKLGIVGGQSLTDLPIRTIVYPSYGVDSNTPSKVLIASYSWTSDAFRLSALASLEAQDMLKELTLRNLAEAHGPLNSEITYEFLKEQLVAMDVKDWNHDPETMGAFAFFGPGEFQDLYTALSIPAANYRLHFAGEAISTRHAWVVGALDSAWKAVYQYLKVTGQTENIKKFKEIWGENVEWTSNSTIVDPNQFEDSADVPDMLDQHLGLVDKAIQGGIIPSQRT